MHMMQLVLSCEGSGEFCVVTVADFRPLPSCTGANTGNCFRVLDGRVNICKDQQGI